MSAPQTSVADVMDIGVSGQLADLYTDEFGKPESLVNTEASLSIPFGVLTKHDTGNGVKLYGATADVIAGVTIFNRDYDYPFERDNDGPLPGLPMETLKKGNVLVQTTTAVTAETGEVHVWIGTENRAATPPVYKGTFRGTASAGNTVKLDPKAARWKTTLGAAGIAELEIDFPQGTLSTPSAD